MPIRLSKIAGALFRRARFEARMSEEMRFHLEEHARVLQESGMTREAAEREARLAFGGVEGVKEEARAAAGLRVIDGFSRDLRHAARALTKHPGFTATAALTLALGMGVNTLMLGATSGLLLRPLPFDDAARLVWVFGATKGKPGERDVLASHEVEALTAAGGAFARVAVIGDAGLVRGVDSRHDRWRGIRATRNLFDVLGVVPAAGVIADAVGGDGPKSIFISHERFVRDFGSDPGIIGRRLSFEDNKHFIVAGVLPAAVEFPFARVPHRGNGAGFRAGVQDFWILEDDRPGALGGGVTIARLRDGYGIEQAVRQAETLASDRALVVVGLRDQVLGPLGGALPLLQAFAVLVLIVACANLATMTMARAAARRVDAAVRTALGARRSEIVRMFVAEASVISVLGTAAGLLLAGAGRGALARLMPAESALVERIALDWQLLALLALACIGTTLLFGIVPAAVWNRDAHSVLAGGSRQAPARTRKWFGRLVVAQVAVSLALAAGALTLRGSVHRLLSVDAGYRADGVVAADMLLFIPAREWHPLIDSIVARLQASPAVEAVGLVHSTPLTAKWSIADPIEILDGPRAGVTPPMSGSFVAYDYFGAMSIPIVAGRDFTRDEYFSGNPPAIILNEEAARVFFPGANPIGARVKTGRRVRQVVGIVKGTRDVMLDTAAVPQWYQPAFLGSSQIIVKGRGPAAGTLALVRRELESADPRLIIERIDRLDAIVAGSIAEQRMTSALASAFASLAVALAGLGLYGVTHFAVVQRRRELALRAALGADRQRLMGEVMARAISLSGAGVAAGILLSVAGARAWQSQVFDGSALSPANLSLATMCVAAVALVACIRPAWRAGTADPILALKAD